MQKIFKLIILILSLTKLSFATCSSSSAVWQYRLQNSPSIEKFFIDNVGCQQAFYPHLNRTQQLYFETVLYPNNLTNQAYINRWRAMLLSDKEFFKTFTFFNNYFAKHHSQVTDNEFVCFQKQKGFREYISQSQFYYELAQKNMLHDVSYLYPLIRWSYAHNGVDMQLSRERVDKAEEAFGMLRGRVGDKKQFAKSIAIFDREYSEISKELAYHLNISQIKAYKLLITITYLESRGNIFALSSTGAFGPTQLTLHYYMIYGEPNNPFSIKASLSKLANKFVHYHRIGKSLDSSVIAYKSGNLTKCQDRVNNLDEDCRYYNNYKHYMREMSHINSKEAISRYLTSYSYFNEIKYLKRTYNPNGLKYYEPYQYAILKGAILRDRAKKSKYLNGRYFNSLGKMKRSEIYKLQDRFGARNIGIASDKSVCY